MEAEAEYNIECLSNFVIETDVVGRNEQCQEDPLAPFSCGYRSAAVKHAGTDCGNTSPPNCLLHLLPFLSCISSRFLALFCLQYALQSRVRQTV